MSKVYVVQRRDRINPKTQRRVPMDFSAAEEFGEVVYLLPSDRRPTPGTEDTIRELDKKLGKMTPEDYLILTGDTVLTSWAVAIATFYTREVLNILSWDARNRCYVAVCANLKDILDE